MGNRLAAVARPASDRLIDLGVAFVLVGGLVLPIVTARAATGDPVLLNEVLVHHSGPDTTEFVELYGTPGHSLEGVSLVVVEGDNSTSGTIDFRFDFDAGDRLGGNHFFLLGSAGGLSANYGVVPDVALSPVGTNVELFENGSQTLALVATATVGAVGTRLTGAEDVLDSVGLWDGADGDSFPWSPVIGPDDTFLPAGARRVQDGVDTDSPGDWVIADDQLGPANTPTPGSPVDEAPPPPGDGTVDELLAAFDALVADESVDERKVAQLRGHLERASSFAAQGMDAAASAQLQAFANHVAGMSARWVRPAAAEKLAAAVAALLAG